MLSPYPNASASCYHVSLVMGHKTETADMADWCTYQTLETNADSLLWDVQKGGRAVWEGFRGPLSRRGGMQGCRAESEILQSTDQTLSPWLCVNGRRNRKKLPLLHAMDAEISRHFRRPRNFRLQDIAWAQHSSNPIFRVDAVATHAATETPSCRSPATSAACSR